MNCGYWLVSLGLCCVELDVFVSEAGYKFNEEKLLEYNHMSFGGSPVTVGSDEEANELLRHIEEESAIGNKKIIDPEFLTFFFFVLYKISW